MKTTILAAFIFLTTAGLSSSALGQDSGSSKGQAEAKFLTSMTEHHKDGIDMAKMATEKAQNSEVKKLAQKISKDQSAEVKKMEAWKTKWYPDINVTPETKKMDTTKLQQVQGSEFDRTFLEMMTEHHKQAIDMTKNSMEDLQHKENRAMAEKSLKKQTAEIEKMEKLKTSLQ